MSEWIITRLDALLDFERGISWSAEDERDVPGPGRFPVLRIPNVQSSLDLSGLLYLQVPGGSVPDKWRATEGTCVIVGSNGNPKRVGNVVYIDKADNGFLFASFLIGGRVKGHIADPRFAFHVLRSARVQDAITASVQGTTGLSNLSLGFLRALTVPLPVIEEQRKIAEILDTIDESIRLAERHVAKLRLLGPAILASIFGNQRTSNVVDDVSNFVELGQVSTRITNGFVGVASPHYVKGATGVPYLYGNNVRANRLDLANVTYVSHRFHEAQAKSQLHGGELLTVQSGHIGTTAVVPSGLIEMNCHALIITRLVEGICDPYFVSAYCNYALEAGLMSGLFVGSTIKHINTSDFAKFRFPLEPIDEQRRVVELLRAHEAVVAAGEADLAGRIAIRRGLAEDLLSGRVRTVVA